MPKFRKKPVVISAEQFFRGIPVPGVEHWETTLAQYLHNAELHRCACPLATVETFAPHIHTLEGPMRVNPGDWVITGVKGEKYACKPDIFEMTYEPAT